MDELKKALRTFEAAVEIPPYHGWTIQQLEEYHDQTPKPKSTYDRLPKDLRPFDWSTPAPTGPNEIPAPWRVAHADRAKEWLEKKFPAYRGDVYTDYGTNAVQGKLTIEVGLRDNRDKEIHASRLKQLAAALEAERIPVVVKERGGRVDVYLVDDLRKDALKMASDLQTSLRAFEAALKKADAVDDSIDMADAIDDKKGADLKKILDRSKGAVSAKTLLTTMKNRGYKVNDVLKLL